jgi:CxxC-x17-CxxC domain-containing protein
MAEPKHGNLGSKSIKATYMSRPSVHDSIQNRPKRRKNMADKSIVCKDCGATFLFTETEQAFYLEKRFENEPQRCPACRAAKKQARENQGGRMNREMFPATCAECGKETMVPFKPNPEKPVYCKDCYQTRRT